MLHSQTLALNTRDSTHLYQFLKKETNSELYLKKDSTMRYLLYIHLIWLTSLPFPINADQTNMELTTHTENVTCKFEKVWNDRGSGADLDGFFFLPILDNGYVMIGGYGAQTEKLAPSDCLLTLTDTDSEMFAEPLDWRLIWKDKGSGAKTDGSMWQAIPPSEDYQCIGSVPQAGYNKPNLNNYRCVHHSLTEQVTTNMLVWSDKGSGAKKEVTIFKLPNSGTFVAVEGRQVQSVARDLSTNKFSKIISNPSPTSRSNVKNNPLTVLTGALANIGLEIKDNADGQDTTNSKSVTSNTTITSDSSRQLTPNESIEKEATKRKTDRIIPFGDLRWEDGIFDIFTKLQSREGVENVLLVAGDQNSKITGVKSKTELAKALEDVVIKKESFNQDIKTKIFSVHPAEYLDKSNIRRKYLAPRVFGDVPILTLIGTPTNITDILFAISVDFYAEPGLAIYKPENVLYSKDSNMYWPLVPSKISLFTISDVIHVESHKKLEELIQEKYGHYSRTTDSYGSDDYGFNWNYRNIPGMTSAQTVYDDHSGSLTIYPSPHEYRIEYKDEEYLTKLRNQYEEHLQSLSVEKSRNIKDASNEL